MNKQQEIDSLHRYIQTLPVDSYIRPWLVEIAPHVENIIRGDMPIELCPRKAQLEVMALRQQAAETVAAMVRAAKDAADRMIVKATEKACEIRQSAGRAVEDARSALDRVIERM